ncbi:MAG: hypothetical protein IKW07_03820, partial [Clostridia bacterium]|nr:hypothetical protein [Clostridia bacterium]
ATGVRLRPQARFEANRHLWRLLGRDGASQRPSDLWVLSVGGKYRAAGNRENGHGFCPVVWCFYGITV